LRPYAACCFAALAPGVFLVCPILCLPVLGISLVVQAVVSDLGLFQKASIGTAPMTEANFLEDHTTSPC